MRDYENLTDAELVTASRAGDQAAFAGIYDRYADRIYSYCLTMLRNRDDAADAAHDAFLEAATRMDQLESPGKLRPRLFAIARNHAHRVGRHKARVTPEGTLSGSLVEDPDLALGVKHAELRELVWAAAHGMGERDQQLMSLHLVEGLEGPDLAEAMGVEQSHLHRLVSRMKDRVEKGIGALLIARLGNDECEELPRALGDWDGTFSMEVRSRVTRHIESCDTCHERRAVLVAPANVLPGIMVVPAPLALRHQVMSSLGKQPVAEPTDGVEWSKMAVFAAVALVVGLIGVAVSAQFNPSASTTPVVAPPADDSTTTTSEPSLPTTTQAESGPGSTTSPSAPASFEVSQDSIDFGADGTSAQIDLTNGGGQAGGWSVASSNAAISFSAGGGELGAGESTSIQVSLDRSLIAEGDLSETLTISWDDGETQVTAVGTHEDNPIIHNPQAGPAEVQVNGGSGCSTTQTTISARVRDTSPLASVVVRWSPDGSGTQETEMSHVGNDIYEAVIGPFTVAQSASARVIGTDERGNAGGATVTVNVIACP